MAVTLEALAEHLGARLVAPPGAEASQRTVNGISSLELAGEEDLSFLRDSRHRDHAQASRARALLVAPGVEVEGKILLECEDPALAAARAAAWLHGPAPRPPGIHATAVVEEGSRVHPEAHLGPYVVIGAGSEVAAGCILHAGVVVGRSCHLGAGCVLHPHVVLYDGTRLGARVEVHAGTVLGSDGFGYVSRADGHHKVPQVGRVVIEEQVEIGANSAVDRATFGETRIGAGTKIDNLVQVGHNVQMGRSCILSGQAGLAGSARLGHFVVLGGQSGSAGHLEIGDGAQVAAKSAVFQSVEPGAKVGGIPAIALRTWQRQVSALSRLPELLRRLRHGDRDASTKQEE